MSLTPARARVFSAYRRLFRARKFLFEGDAYAMQSSREAIKAEFVKNAAIPQEGAPFDELVGTMVDEAVEMLRHGIVRGDLNDQSGHYEVKFKPEHVQHADGHALVEPVTPTFVTDMEQKQSKEEESSSATDDVIVTAYSPDEKR